MQARMAILKAARQLAIEANVHVHIRKFSVSQISYRTCALLVHSMLFFALGTLVAVAPFAQVINEVGAVSIDAKLDCDAFASTHSATSHYDRASFVGLAWRPGGEAVCCGALRPLCCTRHNTQVVKLTSLLLVAEIYSTGKANLPGSTRQRDLLLSFARMVSELLRHSDRPEVCKRIPERLRLCHRPKSVTRDDARGVAHSKTSTAVGSAPASRVSDLFGAGADWTLEPLAPEGVLDDAEVDADGSDCEDLPELAGF